MAAQRAYSRRLRNCHNIDELRRLAKRKLPFPIYDHIAGGADDEVSLAANRHAFASYSLVPSQCAGLDEEEVDMSTQVLGRQLDWPVFSSPWGLQSIIHPHGELGLAAVVHESGTAYGLSAFSEVPLETVAQQSRSGPLFFQLQPARSREMMGDMIDRARAAGFDALILTVDNPTHGNRERDLRSGLGFPPSFSLASWLSIAMRPGWALSKVGYEMQFANYTQYLDSPQRDIEWLFHELLYSTDWTTVRWVAERWGGPMAIKGILSADDARRAVDAGLSAVIVSNQGARHFDCSPAPLEVLPEIVAAVGDDVEVILDGGIRRGTDALKALALGATACSTARPFAYGLAAGGRDGARRALELLNSEIARDMVFLGKRTLVDLNRDDLRVRTSSTISTRW
ncbi:MAG: alpha-hydroxy-acid oxidizing protein [Gammaproteobacteria bacterium]|nr:alpha-hydroxy-acid oxidizing protein [Gammaproteobacteria bacterium]